MPNHETALHRRVLIGALVALIVMAASPGRCQPAQSQEGLPVELVILEEPPLSEQLTTMQALYESGLSFVPKTGILDSIKNMFVSSEQANYLPVPRLVEAAAQLRGELVQTEGMYETDGETGVLRSLGGEIAVELMGGTEPEGFAASDGDPDGMPVMISGRVETQGEEPLLRAEALIPSALIAGLRVGRVAERQEDWEAAVEAYQSVAGQRALSTRPLAAFARIRAGQLLLERLKDQKAARGQFSSAWQPYSAEANGEPVYHTWVPQPGDGWEMVPAAEAMAPTLDRLNSETLAYKIVHVFVRIAGNSAPLGVILMAIVVRLAIFPLTRKQLDSQRRMQAIQPQIKELQQKHATDKQKFQEEFWALCQENNCNPLGGCLPMLIQMPILIFLYRGIRDYIVQFSGQGFLWISNLAQPNMALLILYTLSMVAFQKMAAQATPTTDPQQAQQQKMMAYMMPLMFFFFFQSFPAAFILYWLGSNIIYFGEQALFVYRRRNGAEEEGAAPGDKPAKTEDSGKGGGFVGAMMGAAKRMRGGAAEEEERPLSFAEKRQQEKQRRQEKQRKRRKAR